MAAKRPLPLPEPRRWYRGADIPLRVIRRFARQVAERFQPDQIILFGSYAYGTPHEDSDVDILVVMPCRNQIDQAFKIHVTIDPPFPVQIIVRTPHNLGWRLAEKDSFHTEIVTKGKVLYEKDDAGVGAQGRGRRGFPRSVNAPRQEFASRRRANLIARGSWQGTCDAATRVGQGSAGTDPGFAKLLPPASQTRPGCRSHVALTALPSQPRVAASQVPCQEPRLPAISA